MRPPAIVVAPKADIRGCVCEELDVFWFGNMVLTEKGEEQAPSSMIWSHGEEA